MNHHHRIVVSVLALAPCWGAVAQTQEFPANMSEPLREQIRFQESVKEQVTRGGQATGLEVAQGYLAAAEANLAEGSPWPWIHNLFVDAGLAFLDSANRPLDAVRVFERLEQVGQADSSRRYGAYKAGEILLLDLRDYARAADALGRYRAMMLEHGIQTDYEIDRFAWAMLYLGDAQRGLGDRTAAIATRGALLDQAWTPTLSDVVVEKACVENARDAFAMGDVQGGRAWFDRLFVERPQLGMDDGRVISLLLQRVAAGRELREIRDDESVAEYRAIWNDPSLADLPEIFDAAHSLETALGIRHEFEAQAHVCDEARQRFKDRERAWRAGVSPERFKRCEYMFQVITSSYLMSLQRLQRWDELLFVGREFLNRFPITEFKSIVEQRMAYAATH